MGTAGRPDAPERAVEGTLAEGSFEFDGDAAVLRIEGPLVLTTGWFLGVGAGGMVLLLAGAVLSLTGLQDEARWALAPGAALLAAVACFLLLRLPPPATCRDGCCGRAAAVRRRPSTSGSSRNSPRTRVARGTSSPGTWT